MRVGTDYRGYTILEVMIFLAVSGFMFLIAASFVTGKQSTAEFKQGTSEMNSQLRQVIGDVSNGFFPSTNDFTCLANPSGIVFNSSSNTQGQNEGCVFMGKILQFAPSDGGGSAYYNVMTVAGLRNVGGVPTGLPPQSFAEAAPQIVSKNSVVNLTRNRAIQWNLTVTRVYKTNTSGTYTDTGSIGVFNGFGTVANNNLQSGSQSSIALAIPGTSLGQPSSAVATLVKNPATRSQMDTDSAKNPDVSVCLKGNGARQYALIRIGGGNGERLTTSVHINSSPEGGCPV